MTTQRPKVLTFTTLFPNREQPSHGLFVRERIVELAKLVDLQVVAPVPWFPRIRVLGERYYRFSRVPRLEHQNGIVVDHPRFPVIPRVFKTADGVLLAAGCFLWLRKLRRGFRFDLIDAHWAYPDGVAAAILAKLLNVPFAVTVRGDDINVFLHQYWRRPWIRWALQEADLVIALSSELKEIVVSSGIHDSKVAVIGNGINADAFTLVDREVARARLGLAGEGRIILSVGRLHESKGHSLLVEAVGRLASRFRDLSVYIVGSPDHEADAGPAIRDAAVRYDILGRVHLVGAQEPSMLKYWYGAADVFCLPTAREGSANVLLEAIACGLPCVTTPVGGNPDVIDSRDIGILSSRDVEGIANGIAAALVRSWDRGSISEHGRRRTWGTVAQECNARLLAVARSRGWPEV